MGRGGEGQSRDSHLLPGNICLPLCKVGVIHGASPRAGWEWQSSVRVSADRGGKGACPARGQRSGLRPQESLARDGERHVLSSGPVVSRSHAATATPKNSIKPKWQLSQTSGRTGVISTLPTESKTQMSDDARAVKAALGLGSRPAADWASASPTTFSKAVDGTGGRVPGLGAGTGDPGGDSTWL